MAINKLAHAVLRAAKPTQKPYKLSDGGGLYLLVNPNGALWWRLEYPFEGREKLLSFGVHPHVPSPSWALPMCSRSSNASRAEELMKPPTARGNAAPKYFATPCKPSAPRMT